MIDDEKKRRVYYQDIVYAVCNSLDQIDGKRPGQGVVCGTVDTPTKQVQERMAKLVVDHAGLRNFCILFLARYDTCRKENKSVVFEGRLIDALREILVEGDR